MTTPHFMCFTKELYVLLVVVFALDGIFALDGAECTKPATIEGIVYVASSQVSTQRHRHIQGYCNQVPKGHIRVGFWIGKCESYNLGDGNTGWNSMSRIVIEEVLPPQA